MLLGEELRQQMLDAMQLRGFSPRTQDSYQRAVNGLARYYGRPPNQLTTEEIQQYFLYLVKERRLAPSSCHLYLNGIRFFYLQVVGRQSLDVAIHIPKCPQRIPELLTRREVAAILAATESPFHQMLLACCYGCGLRVSELVNLQVHHIDGERRLLRVEQSKGFKDRYVSISGSLLHRLRQYWAQYRPSRWLFSSYYRKGQPITISTAQHIYKSAKKKAGVNKAGGIHGLRHAYATHQLEAGILLPHLQQQLGHTDIRTTMRYIHWTHVANHPADLIAGLHSHGIDQDSAKWASPPPAGCR